MKDNGKSNRKYERMAEVMDGPELALTPARVMYVNLWFRGITPASEAKKNDFIIATAALYRKYASRIRERMTVSDYMALLDSIEDAVENGPEPDSKPAPRR